MSSLDDLAQVIYKTRPREIANRQQHEILDGSKSTANDEDVN